MTLKTFSLSTLILFASCLAFLQAQDCNNPLLETFELAGLPNPESGASLPYCSNLQSGETCCDNDTVSSFQTMINNLTTSLQNAAAARDQYILALQNQFSQQYQDAAGNLSALSDQISAIQTANPGIGNRISAQRYQIGNISNALTELNNNFQANFQSYQSARQICFDTVLKVQASAWCLACDPNYASLGVRENGTIAFSSNLCTKITQACFPFLSAAVKENALFNAQQSSERLQNLIAYIESITDNNGTIPANPLQGDILRSINATERTVSIPDGCTDAGTCPWQCQNLFSGEGVLNQTVAANGAGQIGGDDVNFDPIGEAAANTRRMLQGGSAWDPNVDGTNLAIVVVSDPANVASSVADGSGITIIPISGRRFGAGSVMVGLLIFIVEIMLF